MEADTKTKENQNESSKGSKLPYNRSSTTNIKSIRNNQKSSQTTYKIFVGGVNPKTKNSIICDYFSAFGKLYRKKTLKYFQKYRKRGFLFVEYFSRSAYVCVLSTRLHDLNGNIVEVKPAFSQVEIQKYGDDLTDSRLLLDPNSMFYLTQKNLRGQSEELTELYFKYRLALGKLDR